MWAGERGKPARYVVLVPQFGTGALRGFFFEAQVFALAFADETKGHLHQIKTAFESPPVPHGDHWVAWSDTLGEDASPYGRGDTKDKARVDLVRQLEEMK